MNHMAKKNKKSILVIDDEEHIRFLLSEEFSEAFPEIETYTAKDIDEAVVKFEKNRSDIVIIDMKMPDTSGIYILQELKRIDSDFRSIGYTAYEDYAYKAGKVGFDAYIIKSSDLTELKNQIKIQLEIIEADKLTKPVGRIFCAMPFHKKYDDVYLYGIKAVAKDLGFVCERVDEQVFTDDIFGQIQKLIRKADVVIADLTGNSPNVYYEVGYAHGKGKTVVLLAENTSDVPFDLRGQRLITYAGHIHELGKQLSITLTELRSKLLEKKKTKKIEGAGGTPIKS